MRGNIQRMINRIYYIALSGIRKQQQANVKNWKITIPSFFLRKKRDKNIAEDLFNSTKFKRPYSTNKRTARHESDS